MRLASISIFGWAKATLITLVAPMVEELNDISGIAVPDDGAIVIQSRSVTDDKSPMPPLLARQL